MLEATRRQQGARILLNTTASINRASSPSRRSPLKAEANNFNSNRNPCDVAMRDLNASLTRSCLNDEADTEVLEEFRKRGCADDVPDDSEVHRRTSVKFQSPIVR